MGRKSLYCMRTHMHTHVHSYVHALTCALSPVLPDYLANETELARREVATPSEDSSHATAQ